MCGRHHGGDAGRSSHLARSAEARTGAREDQAMSDKPILFSSQMVRALLAGTKTQTRRVVPWQGPKGFPHSFEHAIVDNPAGVQRLLVPSNHPDEAELPWGENGYHRHYGKGDPGDRLWVKEALK